ncbi:MAG: hypothetical protein IH945_03125 [Armatimonadetes bacterium]|nr:hypothetical protein [Armatimonadota bacterium]
MDMALGIGIALAGVGIGLGLIGYGAVTGMARQPEAIGKLQIQMLIAFVFVELIGLLAIFVLPGLLAGIDGGEEGGEEAVEEAQATNHDPYEGVYIFS